MIKAEAIPADYDGDGIANLEDSCPLTKNIDGRDYSDDDQDTVGAECDTCEHWNPGQFDEDDDGAAEGCDNCPGVANPDQENSDSDEPGDACDICPFADNPGQEDGDGDGVGNVCDNCPEVRNPDQRDSDGDGQGDACEDEDFAVLDSWVPISDNRGVCATNPWPMTRTSGDTYELTYRSYLARPDEMASREPCETEDGELQPPLSLIKKRPVQLRWCSCQNTTSKVKSLPNDYFFSQDEVSVCAKNYCPTGGDPLKGQVFEDRVGWYEPNHHAEPLTTHIPSVSKATLSYPESDSSIFERTGSTDKTLWLRSPVDTSRWSDEEHYGSSETVYFSGPVPDRQHAPFCATLSEAARAQEDDFHRRTLRWRWIDEFMPVPGGKGYGAQARLGGFQKVMIWMRSNPARAAQDAQNTFVYPEAPLEVRCTLRPFLYEVGMLSRIIRPGDPELETNHDRRVFAAIEVRAGHGAGFEEYFYPAPVGELALTEGLVVQPYSPASDLFDRPLPSSFTQGSLQMEGRGLRMVELRPPVLTNDGAEMSDTAQLGERVLAAYGGAYTDGTFEPGLWLGRIDEQESLVRWTGPIVSQVAPEARAETVLLASPASRATAVLFGGRSSEGLEGDLWTITITPNHDVLAEVAEPGGEVPSPRAEVGFAQSSDLGRAYLFGGQVGNGLSGELFALDLGTLTFERLWPPDGGSSEGPEPRRGASVELDEVYGRVLVYGGADEDGPRNDLWSYRLFGGVWERLSAQCSAELCPPLAESAALVLDRWSGRIRVLPGYAEAEHDEPSWSFVPAEGWAHSDSIAQEQSGDCDGDGEPEPGHGLRCRSTPEWWAPVGALRCGGSGLVCSASEAEGSVADRAQVPGARELALVGDVALVLGTRLLQAVDLAVPGAPVKAGSARLSGAAQDIAVGDGSAFVAVGRAVEVVDISTPLEPVVAGRTVLSDTAEAVTLVGSDTLVTATSRGLAVLDVSDPGSPEEVAFLWLRRRPRHGWEVALDDGDRRPPWRGSWGGCGPRDLATTGSLAVLSAQGDLLVIDVSDPLAPELLGTVALGEPIERLRASGDEIYVAGPPWHDLGPVVDVTFPRAPVVVGEHEVSEWVRGAELRGGWAYRVVPRGLEVAEVGLLP